jgi:hypothetical protein
MKAIFESCQFDPVISFTMNEYVNLCHIIASPDYSVITQN